MEGNLKGKQPSMTQLKGTLEELETQVVDSSLQKRLTQEFVHLIHMAQRSLEEGRTDECDNALSLALLLTKRNLGAEINLRLAFDLSSTIIESVKRYIADPAHLYAEAVDFSGGFLGLLAETPIVSSPPGYLQNREFPKNVRGAARQVRDVIKSYEVPKDLHDVLNSDINELEKLARQVRRGKPTLRQSRKSKELVASLYVTLAGAEGTYVTERQVNAVMGLVLFSWPAWLCWNPAAWVVQCIVHFIHRIIRELTADKKVLKGINYIWIFIEDCLSSVEQTKNKVTIEMNGLSKKQKEEILAGLSELKKYFSRLKYTGKKAEVLRKLNAAIDQATWVVETH